MSTASMPKYGDDSKILELPRQFTLDEKLEALLIAAWREQRWDVIVGMINARCGLQLVFTDPLFDDVEG